MTDIPTNSVRQLVMQQFKCVSFLLGVAILSATLESLVTNAHRELLMVTNGDRQLQTKLAITELTVEETKSDEIRNNVIAGQKMTFGDVVMQKMETKDARGKPSPGAIHSDGKCGHGERKDYLSMNCYSTSRKPRRGVDFDGRIPFSADYHQPHNHPPKNN